MSSTRIFHSKQILRSLKNTYLTLHSFLQKSRGVSTNSKFSEENVFFEVANNRGIITLNRPKQLNAINKHMARRIQHKLVEWEKKVDMVVIKSEGKAFCAGGDIVENLALGYQQHQMIRDNMRYLFYLTNVLISQYSVPYIALIDGIVMGAGAGLSVHGKIRVATERAIFAMPETMIGFFPDSGVNYIFSRLPHQLGQYLGLTGHRLKGADIVKLGIATHYVKSENIPKLLNGLLELNEPKNNLNKILITYAEDTSNVSFSLNPHIETIERAFSAPTVEEIIKRLEKDGSQFALNTVQLLNKISPVSLKISRKFIEMAKNMSLMECFALDGHLAGAFVKAIVSADMYEGVRALLIDKDKNPKWNPATLEDVTEEMLEKVFDVSSDESNFMERLNKLRS